jgi:dihydroxy-acid dehydratase
LLQNGDAIAIDIPNRTIEAKVSEQELANRRAKATFQPKRERPISQALRAYALFAASADQGAVRILPEN